MNEDNRKVLMSNIEERLDLLCTRLHLDTKSVVFNYLTRVNNLKIVYPQEYLSNESKFMVKAYQGTVKYFEEKVK